jgi:hypothetical protein
MTHPNPPHPSNKGYWDAEIAKATRALAANKKRIESSGGTKNAGNETDEDE